MDKLLYKTALSRYYPGLGSTMTIGGTISNIPYQV